MWSSHVHQFLYLTIIVKIDYAVIINSTSLIHSETACGVMKVWLLRVQAYRYVTLSFNWRASSQYMSLSELVFKELDCYQAIMKLIIM